MASKQHCARCGKTLRPGVGPDGPMTMEMTGEKICGECMMKMLEAVSPGVNDNYEVKEFRRKAVDELAQQTGVERTRISIHCKQFIGHDVEIKIENNIYAILFIYDLIEDRRRWKQSRDYLVSWMKQHPLRSQSWTVQTSDSRALPQGGRFVFIFLPESYPKPASRFGKQVAQELCRGIAPDKIRWMVYPVCATNEQAKNQDIAVALSTWTRTQTDPDSLRFHPKKVRFHFSPDQCDCIIVQR